MELRTTARAADRLLGLAHDLTVKLPATSAALHAGIIDAEKADIIASWCTPLTATESREAERILFEQHDAGNMTSSMIRERITRAVMEVNPEAARRRREEAAKRRRVEVRTEESGNTSICGRELPPAAALAANANLTARARHLRKLGAPGSMDDLRVQAFLEAFGVQDPQTTPAARTLGNASRTGDATSTGSPAPAPASMPIGVNITVPLATLKGRADRPGTASGIGAIDADLARDLVAAASRNPRSVYCVTVLDETNRPYAHGCATPTGRGTSKIRQSATDVRGFTPPTTTRAGPESAHGPAPGSHPERDPDSRAGPLQAEPDPDSGARLLQGPDPGKQPRQVKIVGLAGELTFDLEPLADPCDHKHQAAGHDPGRKLRHLTGILHTTCTNMICRRPASQSDYEHSKPFDKGGLTCLCEAGPVCRRNHRDKQQPGWRVEGGGFRGWFTWTTPAGRSYLSKPTQYPA